MSFERARAVADAVLFEGYALYPYRPSSKKNASRWQFGVLAPRAFSEADGGEAWWLEAQCLVACPADARLVGKLRFLHLRRRRVFAPEPVESVEVEGRLLVSWDEGNVQEIDFGHEVGEGGETRFELSGETDEELVRHADGRVGALVERKRWPVAGRVSVRFERVDAGPGCVRVHVRVENHTPWWGGGSRDEAMAASLLGAHLLLSVPGAQVISLIDPPDWASEAAAACKNVRCFPVLAGERTRRDVVLAAPIILYDYPEVAPESPGDLFDATEIDEILTLRTRTLTPEEKREACAADPRVAALIRRVDSLPREAMERLHGAIRGLRPVGASFAPGEHVRLRPGPRRTDAQDMFLDGMTATVRSVMQDVDGRVCLAVTVDDDPAAELHLARGLFHYFYVDEIERIDPVTSS